MNYDYRVSEDERTVIWCIANQVHLFYRLLVLNIFRDVKIFPNQNNFLLGVQILVFMSLFAYVIFNFDKVRNCF